MSIKCFVCALLLLFQRVCQIVIFASYVAAAYHTLSHRPWSTLPNQCLPYLILHYNTLPYPTLLPLRPYFLFYIYILFYITSKTLSTVHRMISMRHSGIPFFGYYPGAKAVTSLLRVAANLVPQVLLPGKPCVTLLVYRVYKSVVSIISTLFD